MDISTKKTEDNYTIFFPGHYLRPPRVRVGDRTEKEIQPKKNNIMKRIIALLFIAALAAAAITSCRKDDSVKEDVIVLEEPAFAQNAAKYTFVEPVTVGESLVKSIEFTESGYAIITKLVSVTKADIEYVEVTEIVPYSVSEQGTYQVESVGEVIPAEGSLVIAEQSYPATVEVASEEVDNTDIYRTWTVEAVDISVRKDGESVGVGKIFRHGNLDLIADWVIEKGYDISDIEGYNIVDVTLTKLGTLLVNFEESEPFTASITIKDGEFSYYSNQIGNSFLNAEATGTVEVKNGKCKLAIAGSAENNGNKYRTTVTLTLVEKK